MDSAPTKDKAAGGEAPAASECRNERSNDTPAPRFAQRDGTKSGAVFMGTALRHSREALSICLREGPGCRMGREILRARAALDSAHLLCEYAEGDR